MSNAAALELARTNADAANAMLVLSCILHCISVWQVGALGRTFSYLCRHDPRHRHTHVRVWHHTQSKHVEERELKEQVAAIFCMMDTDSDGYLSVEEAHRVGKLLGRFLCDQISRMSTLHGANE